MSFTASIPKSTKADFSAAVDAATESPVQTTDKGKALVAALKSSLKSVADQFDGDLPIAGSLYGHVCEDGQPGNDSAGVSVQETT